MRTILGFAHNHMLAQRPAEPIVQHPRLGARQSRRHGEQFGPFRPELCNQRRARRRVAFLNQQFHIQLPRGTIERTDRCGAVAASSFSANRNV